MGPMGPGPLGPMGQSPLGHGPRTLGFIGPIKKKTRPGTAGLGLVWSIGEPNANFAR